MTEKNIFPVYKIPISRDSRFGSSFLDQISEWIGDNLEPDEVFTIDQLRDWAKENGYVLAYEVTRKMAVKW